MKLFTLMKHSKLIFLEISISSTINSFKITLDLLRQQEELRRLEEMRQQEQIRRRQELEMR